MSIDDDDEESISSVIRKGPSNRPHRFWSLDGDERKKSSRDDAKDKTILIRVEYPSRAFKYAYTNEVRARRGDVERRDRWKSYL